jgi:hypothetical protein
MITEKKYEEMKALTLDYLSRAGIKLTLAPGLYARTA